MNTEENMQLLEDLVDKAWQLPLSNGKCVVDADAIREVVEDMRQNLPPELKQARAIVADRNEIISTAKKEAESIRKSAEDKAAQLVNREEISRQARQQANEILSQANQKAHEVSTQASIKAAEVKQAANDYIDGLLKRTEEAIGGALSEVRQAHLNMKNSGR